MIFSEAIKKEDVMSIETLQMMAVELGTTLAGVINIFNPRDVGYRRRPIGYW